MRCEISPLAEFDLEEIGDYIARDNPSRAVSFVREIRACCDKIAYNPEAAPLRHDLGEVIRMAIFGRYLIFYTADSESVRIERILHGARNIPALFDA
jgi:toxin ParE1/3/4